jgi:hypothetical protein
MKKSLCFAIVGFLLFMCLSAEAAVLVYEPFDYPDGLLNGQGGALGTTGAWTTTDTGFAEGWWCHPEGEVTGQFDDRGGGLNMFDGTVENLPTSGGFVGSAGPEEQGSPFGTRDPTGNMDGHIGLDPSVTATFQSGTVTWFSYVGGHADNRNQGSPTLMICTDPTVNGSRGLTMENSGNGIGGVGGPPRFNLQDVYPHYFSGGVHHQTPGGYSGGVFGAHDGIVTAFCSTSTCDGALDEAGQPLTQTMAWQISDDKGFGASNIVVGKIEWDADTGGEDIISVVRFLETDQLSEAAFDALIAALPPLSSANWASNKPSLDQSQFDTLNISSLKFYVDEIRIATTFAEVIGGIADPTLPDVDAGADMITWSGGAVQLDPNVVNNDPCEPQTPLTYAWSAIPADGVVFDSNTIEAPTVTITKPALTLSAVTIGNAGFEQPVLADGGWQSPPPAWTSGYYDVTSPGVWVVGESASGVYNPTTADGYGGIAPEGDNVMYTTSGAGYDKGTSQVLSATLQANTQYNLTALVGNPFLFNGSTTTANYRMELLAGGVLLASDTGTSPANDTTWKTAGLTYNSGAEPAQLAEALEIRLLAVNFTDGKGVDFDDVGLTAEGPTPDPYVVMLTLDVNKEGRVEPPIRDTMKIDVYDNACKAARIGKNLAEDNPGDFNGDCITDANDLAELATNWVNDTGLTAPIPKP